MNTIYKDKVESMNQDTNVDTVNEIRISHITEMQIPEFLRKYQTSNN